MHFITGLTQKLSWHRAQLKEQEELINEYRADQAQFHNPAAAAGDDDDEEESSGNGDNNLDPTMIDTYAAADSDRSNDETPVATQSQTTLSSSTTAVILSSCTITHTNLSFLAATMSVSSKDLSASTSPGGSPAR